MRTASTATFCLTTPQPMLLQTTRRHNILSRTEPAVLAKGLGATLCARASNSACRL